MGYPAPDTWVDEVEGQLLPVAHQLLWGWFLLHCGHWEADLWKLRAVAGVDLVAAAGDVDEVAVVVVVAAVAVTDNVDCLYEEA